MSNVEGGCGVVWAPARALAKGKPIALAAEAQQPRRKCSCLGCASKGMYRGLDLAGVNQLRRIGNTYSFVHV